MPLPVAAPNTPESPAAPTLARVGGAGRRPLLWLRVLELLLLLLFLLSPLLDRLLPPVLLATLVLVFEFHSALSTGQLLARAFVLAFAVGHFGSMVFANAAYVAFTNLPQFGDHTDSMWLTLGQVIAAFVGMRALELVAPLRIERDPAADAAMLRPETLVVTGSIFAALTLLFYTTGLQNARWDAEYLSGLAYVTLGLYRLTTPFLFVLGYWLTPGLLKPRNLLIIGVGLLLALFDGVTGYRERALIGVFTFGLGAVARSVVEPRMRRELRLAALAVLPLLAIYIQVIGSVRDQFAYTTVEHRVELFAEGLSGEQHSSAQADSDEGSDMVISRLFELSGQDVIARVKNSGYEAGFEHFERLLYVMVPRFILPNQPEVEDGPEILARDFHYYHVVDGNSVPITLVADCYRRGGLQWVLVVGLIAGMWLRFIAKATARIVRGPLAVATILLQSLRFLRLYPPSLTGFVSLVTWHWIKEALMFAALSTAIVLVGFLFRGQRGNAPPLAPPARGQSRPVG